MQFALFLLLNAILFIRPEEIWPEIAGLRLYLIAICACLMANADRLMFLLSPASLRDRPLDVCVLVYWFATGAGLVFHGRTEFAQDTWWEFAKVAAFYFVCVATLDTPARFRSYLGWLVGFAGVMSGLAVLSFLNVIKLDVFETVMQSYQHPVTGEMTTIERICGIGVFKDPNDLCLLVAVGTTCCLARCAAAGWVGVAWLAPIGLFGYTLVLTQSRGGFLTILAALAGGVFIRYGWKRAFPLIAVCGPALMMAVGGRQSDMNVGGGDTANERVMLWAQGISYLLSLPLWIPLGIGYGGYAEEFVQVAHNSFVHAYVELGLLGGTMLLCLAIRPAVRLYRLAPKTIVGPDWFVSLRPWVFGLLVGYAMGMFSLSRGYVVPTFLVFAVGRSYLGLASPTIAPEDKLNLNWWVRTAVFGVFGFTVLKFLTQALGMMGA